MLYFIKDSVNDFIKAHLNEAAMVIIEPSTEFAFNRSFTQCKETDEGLLISSGYDDYIPSSTMRMLRGKIEFDEPNKKIHIRGDYGNFEIVEATGPQLRNIRAYLGSYTTDDVEMMKHHIKQIENA